jgi:hypothetical protein
MTLTRWLRDYLFYPIALSRPLGIVGVRLRGLFGYRVGKIIPTAFAAFCVYFAMGVWHGAGAHLLVFGFFNGSFIAAGILFEPLVEKLRRLTKIRGTVGFGKIFAIFRTLGLVMFLRFFARADSLRHALQMGRQTVRGFRFNELWDGTLLTSGLGWFGFAVLGFGVAALFIRDLLAERGMDCRSRLNASSPVLQFTVLFALLFSIVLFGVYLGDATNAAFIHAAH